MEHYPVDLIREKCKLLDNKYLLEFMLSNKRIYEACSQILSNRKIQHDLDEQEFYDRMTKLNDPNDLQSLLFYRGDIGNPSHVIIIDIEPETKEIYYIRQLTMGNNQIMDTLPHVNFEHVPIFRNSMQTNEKYAFETKINDDDPDVPIIKNKKDQLDIYKELIKKGYRKAETIDEADRLPIF